jgi:hypothetical protein
VIRLHLGEVGIESEPAVWDLSSRPHGLIVGETGAGKSYLARLLIEQASGQADVWIADGKGGDDFGRSTASSLALGPAETLELLDRVADEAAVRTSRARDVDRGELGERPLLCVVDELAALQLRHRGEDAKASRERRDRLQGSLGEIALTGRSAGIHLLVLLQRPDTDSLPGQIRDQLGLRITLGWMSNDGYRMVFGISSIEPPRSLEPGNGWISGYAGHRDGPRPFVVTGPRSQRRSTFLRRGGR